MEVCGELICILIGTFDFCCPSTPLGGVETSEELIMHPRHEVLIQDMNSQLGEEPANLTKPINFHVIKKISGRFLDGF